MKTLVHRADIAAQPHLWEVIEYRQAVGVPEVEKVPLEPPVSMAGIAREVRDPIVANIGQGIASASPLDPVPPAVPMSDTLPRSVADMGELSLPPRNFVHDIAGGIRPNAIEILKDATAQPDIPIQPVDLEQVISGKVEHPPKFELQKIIGVNAPIAEQLVAAGCKNREDVAKLGVEKLLLIKGIGKKRASMIFEAANAK